MASGKILVAQGGGPTAVINQSLVGVALKPGALGLLSVSTVRAMACGALWMKTLWT